ncbi:hypothetical protein ACVBEF_01260 [Glaciimonas sp. GG7]
MKPAADKKTFSVCIKPDPDHSRKRRTKSASQRLREYRQRKKFNFLHSVTSHEKSS